MGNKKSLFVRNCCRIFVFCCLVYTSMIFDSAQAASVGPKNLLPDWLSFSGWLDTMHSVRIRSPHDRMSSRARLRLEAKADIDWLYLFYSLDAEKNWIISKETGIDTHEFWLEHAADTWDIRIGRQIIIWGQADGVQITDMISPPDLTESITRDLDEIRMPVDAVRFRILGNTVTSEFILIPVFQEALYPQGDNPWAVSQKISDQSNSTGTNVVILPADKPDTSLENMEIAAKVSGYFSGLDVAASAFYTWDDTPALHPSLDGHTLVINPKHHRLTIFGLAFSRPWSDFVFRGEAAFYQRQYLACSSPASKPLARNLVKWLAGVDWTPGNDWTITAQVVGQSIFHYRPSLTARKDSFLGTLNISRKLMNERLTISNMLYLDCDNSGLYDQLKADYEVCDGFHLSAGLDIFQGNGEQFKKYENNSQVWIKAKYDF